MQAARERRVELYTSTPLLAELTDILGRPRFAPKITASLLSLDQLVDRYAALAALVRPAPMPRIAPDPDDDVVIATALAARAEFVVTGDQSLLSVAEYQSVRIVRVSEAINAALRWGQSCNTSANLIRDQQRRDAHAREAPPSITALTPAFA